VVRDKWHRNSEFGPGPRRALSLREHLAIRLRIRELAYTRHLPAKQEWVGIALLKYVGADGQCDPCHQTLAEHVGCTVRTVQRALARLRELGVVRWVRRLIRDGWRTAQTSNAYEFCDGQSVRESPPILNLPKRKEGAMRTAQKTEAWPPLPERSVEQQLYELRHGHLPPRQGGPIKPLPPAHSVDQQLAALGLRRDANGDLVKLD
jgi:DNA-binding transcriptional MocR family regulator